MIYIRSDEEISRLRNATGLTARTMRTVLDRVAPGVTTAELGRVAQEFIESNGGKPAFLGYNGFPGAICVSVNEEVVHGIPSERSLEDGDIVKIDIGTFIDGFYGDMSRTVPVGDADDETKRLIDATEGSLYRGIAAAVEGNTVGDIGYAIQSYVEARGFSVVRALVGHGIGRHLHEEPQVPNFGISGRGPRLKKGMVLAIEPMVNAGTYDVDTLDDDWTVVTADRALSAHFENTVLVGEEAAEILTLMDGEDAWQKKIQ